MVLPARLEAANGMEDVCRTRNRRRTCADFTTRRLQLDVAIAEERGIFPYALHDHSLLPVVCAGVLRVQFHVVGYHIAVCFDFGTAGDPEHQGAHSRAFASSCAPTPLAIFCALDLAIALLPEVP